MGSDSMNQQRIWPSDTRRRTATGGSSTAAARSNNSSRIATHKTAATTAAAALCMHIYRRRYKLVWHGRLLAESFGRLFVNHQT